VELAGIAPDRLHKIAELDFEGDLLVSYLQGLPNPLLDSLAHKNRDRSATKSLHGFEDDGCTKLFRHANLTSSTTDLQIAPNNGSLRFVQGS
jgi:hypothetical protein